MKKIMLLALCGLISSVEHMNAQNLKCGNTIIKENIIASSPNNAALMQQRSIDLIARANAYATSIKGTAQKNTNIVTIPVVFHVILTAAQQNQLNGDTGIRARAISQIAALNRDYLKQNSDTVSIPYVYKPLAANTGIQFGLAHRKPDGTSTEGFEIITTTTSGYSVYDGMGGASTAKHTSSGGADAWDPTKYLNIWVLNISETGIIGFTDPPSYVNFGIAADEIGIGLNYAAFGNRTSTSQYFFSGIDKGRTLTHEMGHFFELEHVWGDDGGLCPSDPGGLDDGIADTPPQASENYGNPVFPHISCNNGPGGDMFMNYMDYSNDLSLLMFTIDQVARMQSNVNTESLSLTQHPEILQWPTGVTNIDESKNIAIYPNPTSGKFTVNTNDVKGVEKILVLNMIGQTVYSINVNNAQITNYNIDLTGMSKGIYMVQCTFARGTVTKKIVLQ